MRRLRTQRNSPVEPMRPVEMGEIDETWECLRHLPGRQRTALVLRYYLDMPISDIAEAMSTREGTVKSLLHRGREALRKELS